MNILDWISLGGTLLTLVAFVLGWSWNYKSNRTASKHNKDMFYACAKQMIEMRKMEIEKIEVELQNLNDEADYLIMEEKYALKNNECSDSELQVKYGKKKMNLGAKIMRYKQLKTKIDLSTVDDADVFMKNVFGQK